MGTKKKTAANSQSVSEPGPACAAAQPTDELRLTALEQVHAALDEPQALAILGVQAADTFSVWLKRRVDVLWNELGLGKMSGG